jgi:hypothetical protein
VLVFIAFATRKKETHLPGHSTQSKNVMVYVRVSRTSSRFSKTHPEVNAVKFQQAAQKTLLSTVPIKLSLSLSIKLSLSLSYLFQ